MNRDERRLRAGLAANAGWKDARRLMDACRDLGLYLPVAAEVAA